MNAFWIILTGSLVAISCAILGSFLILRRMAMIGDAISHAILPGIVAAFLLTGGRNTLTMLVSAGLIGVFTTFIIEFFHQKARLQTDASIGVSFTFLFALGVAMIAKFAAQVDIDTECVLFGEIAYVPLDIWITASGQNLGPLAVWIMGFVLIVILGVVMLFYRPLFITTFDPSYAKVIGFSVVFWHYCLMSLVSLTTVAAFDSVGAILVLALMIAPPASAYLLTHNFKIMLFLSSGIGILASVMGYGMATWLDASVAGCMATSVGFLFFIAFSYHLIHKRNKVILLPPILD